MEKESPILCNKRGSIGQLILNRPKAFNSFNREMALSFQKEFKSLADNDEIRVISIEGSGKAFCAGQDLKEVTGDQNPGFQTILDEHFNPVIKIITSTLKPVVACVNGVAAGAGANLALACDYVLAKESMSFIQAFVNIGLVPDSGGSYIIPRKIGMARAKALLMLGDKLTAKKAEEIGLIAQVCKDGDFENEVEKILQRFAVMPTYAIGLIKDMLNQSVTNNLEQQLELEKKYQIQAAHSEDYTEGVNAFLEKRKPTFKGK